MDSLRSIISYTCAWTVLLALVAVLFVMSDMTIGSLEVYLTEKIDGVLSPNDWVHYILVLDASMEPNADNRWSDLRAFIGNSCFVEWPAYGSYHVTVHINCRESSLVSRDRFQPQLLHWTKMNANHVIVLVAANCIEDAYTAIVNKAISDIEMEMAVLTH